MSRLSMLVILGACLALCGSSFAQPPSNGYIGVFGDAAGTDCCITLNKSGNGKLYVYAVTGGASSAGLSGAEFKISVEPPAPGAMINWTPAPDVLVSNGDPVDNGNGGGAFITFKNCQTQTGLAGDKILLGALHVLDLTDEHQLVVRAHDAPINSEFNCASVLLCDAPAYTQVCLTMKEGDPALNGEEPVAFISALNSPTCSGASCGFVATEETTWSTIKDLYR